LLKHTSLSDEGLVDCRGLSLPRGVDISGARFSEIDLSFSEMHGIHLERCRFAQVSLRQVETSYWNERFCYFEDVDFSGAKMLDAALGMRPSTYNRVAFCDVDFSGAHIVCADFTSCDFSRAKLERLDFGGSRFVDCRFAGRLEEVWFNAYARFPSDRKLCGENSRNEMSGVDFSEAELWDVMFTGGIDLSTVVLPQDGSHLLFRRFDLVLKQASEMLASLAWPETLRRRAEILINSYRGHAAKQPIYIVNRREIAQWMGERPAVELLDLLLRLDEHIGDSKGSEEGG